MAKKILNPLFLALLVGLALTGCDRFMPKKTEPATVEPSPKPAAPKKELAFDDAATQKLRADLTAQFPEGSKTEEVEIFLKSQDYLCGKVPEKDGQKSCNKASTENNCIILSSVNTSPYTPSEAQVLKACGFSDK